MEKKRIQTPEELEEIRSSKPMELYHPHTIPVQSKILVMRSDGNNVVTDAGIIINTNAIKGLRHIYYVCAISDDCNIKNLEIGDEVVPFFGAEADIKFQVITEVHDGNVVEFGVMYDHELAGYRKSSRTIIWKNRR